MEVDQKEQNSKLRSSLMRLLARREHSRQELFKKMLIRGFDEGLIQPNIDDFTERNWQSDARYASMLLRSRVLKCQGPIKIKMELQQNGVSEAIIEHCMKEPIDWHALTINALSKKFSAKPVDQNERNKQYRFLIQRGFTNDQIKFAINDLK